MKTDKSDSNSKVLDLTGFRRKKQTDHDLGGGRKPLYVSHLQGRVSGSPHLNGKHTEDFGDRMQKIKSSLEKINHLMSELKRMSATADGKK